MVKERERSASVVSEAAFLVGVTLEEQDRSSAPSLQELEGLTEAAGATVVGHLTQRRQRPDPATYLGRGKVDELKGMVEMAEANVVIFDNDLSPAQTRNLEKAIDVKVLDRTELILDIFATRAKTHEARLAVELAQLEYAMPRLKRMWTHLSRQAQGGVGLRGPGETQLEVDRRLAQKRIIDLRTQLNLIHQRKQREVSARGDAMTVSLVGYTNAGKSTLLNALTQSDVYVKDQLFATLDTRTRRWHLPGWGPVLLSDTVGFIRNLPHHLIASFRATLEESRQADLLLHVADGGNPAVEQQVTSAYQVLEDIGIEAKDTLLVINKIDRMADPMQVDGLLNRYPTAVAISAQTGQGLDRLAVAVSEALSRHFREVDVELGIDNGRIMAYLADKGEIISRRFGETSVVIHCRISPRHLGRIEREPGITIRPHESLSRPGDSQPVTIDHQDSSGL